MEEVLTEFCGPGVDAFLSFWHERGGRVGAGIGRAWTRHSSDNFVLEDKNNLVRVNCRVYILVTGIGKEH
jgi:hypothetical protein